MSAENAHVTIECMAQQAEQSIRRVRLGLLRAVNARALDLLINDTKARLRRDIDAMFDEAGQNAF